jgi:general secretion pathway protein J
MKVAPRFRHSKEGRRSLGAGFTLLELLIALTLMSLLTVVILGALGTGARVWERASAGQQIVEETVVARKFLRRWLEQAYPLVDRSEPLRPVVVFRGTKEGLDLVAPVPRGIMPGGLTHYSIFVQRNGGRSDLLVTLRHERADENIAALSSSVLIEDIGDMSVAYFGAQRATEPEEWHDGWTDATNLPELVRISIAFPPGDKRTWTDLNVTPRIRAPADCEYNQLTKSCRGF